MLFTRQDWPQCRSEVTGDDSGDGSGEGTGEGAGDCFCGLNFIFPFNHCIVFYHQLISR